MHIVTPFYSFSPQVLKAKKATPKGEWQYLKIPSCVFSLSSIGKIEERMLLGYSDWSI
jgi:hypothetical protein